jgi:hypothetical protein
LKKVLVISHVPINSTYGAATSLRGHFSALEKQKDYLFGLVLPGMFQRAQFTKNNDPKMLESFNAISWHKDEYLKYRLNNHGPSNYVLSTLKNTVKNFLHYFNRPKLMADVIQFKPDLIHFNSLVLAPMARFLKESKELASVPIISHVREMLDEKITQIMKMEIAMVDGFVCIDMATRDGLLAMMGSRISTQKVFTIQNPFRSSLATPDPNLFREIDWTSSKIFAIAGQVSPDKGVKLVCDAFLKANVPKSFMAVAGKERGSYGQLIKTVCKSHPSKMMWLGEQPNLTDRGFFNGICAIVRGDSAFCTGRTVYEALFAGAGALLPGTQRDLDSDMNLYPFNNKIKMYEPTNLESLTKAFQDFSDELDNARPLTSLEHAVSNYDLYAKSICDGYKKVLQYAINKQF